MSELIRLYHSTTAEAAAAIERDGFRDNPTASFNRAGELCRGVWFADRDVTDAFSLGGDTFLVEIPADAVRAYEWPDDPGWRTNWRGFLVPAEVANRYPRSRIRTPHVHAGPRSSPASSENPC